MKQSAKNIFTTTILSALAVLTIVACNKKSDGGSSPEVVVSNCGVNACINPNGPIYAGSGNLANNVRFSYAPLGLEGAVSLTAISTNSFVDYNDPSLPAKFYGAFAAQGTVTMQTNLMCGNIPLSGSYVLTGSEGMYSAGILSGFIWNLSGPTNIQLIASGSSVLYGDVNGLLRDGNTRMGLSVSVYVNNQYCGYIYTQ